MKTNFTFLTKCIALVIITLLSAFPVTYAQTSPKLSFASPVLVSGTAGQKHAIYKFSNVVAGVDAFVKIEDIKNGAVLVNIDDSTLGYYDAWQPTVDGPGTIGTSYIKWAITFKTTSGADYQFPLMDLTAVDIDGDNVRVREFLDVNGQSSADVPTIIPSLLQVTNTNDDDNVDGDDENTQNLHVLGPVANRIGIDTLSLDVKMNFHFTNQSKIKITTGSQIDDNGTTGAIATSRYNSLYFKSTTNFISVLPVTYRNLFATLNNNAVNVSWTTIDAETKDDSFEVERSFDQVKFSTVGVVLAPQADNGVSSQFNFKDGSADLIKHNIVYYRVKQVNIDGKYEYSDVKMVHLDAAVKAIIQVLPNPYMDKLNINFVSNETGNAQVRLVSASGVLVKIASAAITKGYNSIQLQNLSSQAAGFYIANITVNGKGLTSLKVMKQ